MCLFKIADKEYIYETKAQSIISDTLENNTDEINKTIKQ